MNIPLKTFCHEEAARRGVSPMAIYNAIYRGRYIGIELLRHSARKIDVVKPGVRVNRQEKWLGDFVRSEAARCGRSTNAIYRRLKAGRYRDGEYLPLKAWNRK